MPVGIGPVPGERPLSGATRSGHAPDDSSLREWWPGYGRRPKAPVIGDDQAKAPAVARRATASLRVVLRDRLLPLLQVLFEAPARPGREPPRDPLDARLAEFLEHLWIGWHAHHLNLDGPVGAGAQLGDAVVHLGVVIGEPGVAEPKHSIEDGGAGAANEHWWVWPLRRLRPRPDPVEVDVFAVVAGLVMGPDLLHGLDPLPHDGHPNSRVGAMIAHLGPVPARTHAELQAAAREVVDARDLFRGDDRVTFHDQADAAGDADVAGRLRGGGKRDEQIVRAPVFRRQRLPGRPVSLRGRDVSVLSEVDGAVAALLGHPRDLAGPHAVVGGKVSETEFHTQDLPGTPAFHQARRGFRRRRHAWPPARRSRPPGAAHQHCSWRKAL